MLSCGLGMGIMCRQEASGGWMSGLIAVCVRDRSADGQLSGALERCARRLAPDNISARSPSTVLAPGIGFIVTNPAPGLAVNANGVCLGALRAWATSWSRVSTPAPDGSYVILRHDDEALELVSDTLASRTVLVGQDGRALPRVDLAAGPRVSPRGSPTESRGRRVDGHFWDSRAGGLMGSQAEEDARSVDPPPGPRIRGVSS